MKRKRLLFILLPLLASFLTGCSCSVFNAIKDNILGATGEEQYGYRLSTYKKDYVIGEKYTFYYYNYENKEKVIYDNATLYVVGAKYSVDNPSILSIDEVGNTKALKEGKTTVYLTCPKGFNFKCEVTVEKKKLTELEVSNYRSTYYTGKAFNFQCETNAVYQNGYKEFISPTIDTSAVDNTTVGTYDINISYTLDGVTKTVTKQITMLDGDSYTISKTEMDYHLSDLEHNAGAPILPKSGSPKMLIIPVKFNDSNAYISKYDNVKDDIETVFFGNSSSIGYESVRTYYEKESFNKVSLTGTVSDWYECGKSSFQIENSSTVEKIKNNAIEWYFSNNPTDDRKSYDLDNDGYLDGVVLVYGSPDYVTGDLGNLCSHMWASVSSSTGITGNTSKPVACGYMWVSYDFLYPTKDKARNRTGKSEYAYSAYVNSKMGFLSYDPFTFIHETGHMFGLSDYYSYTESERFYAGDANMQSASLLTHDPYSLMLFGWANPYIVDDEATITIGGFVDTHDFIMIKGSSSAVNSPFDEYILIDLYTPTGLNKFHAVDHPSIRGTGGTLDDLSFPGIRIWHVDARLSDRNKGYGVDYLTNDPTSSGATYIADNSLGSYTSHSYDGYVELTQIRNDPTKKLIDLSYNRKGDLFQTGDTFDQDVFYKQFANGTKLDNDSSLGWTIKVDLIMHTGEGYVADITVNRK
ncbi:MAG: hypothetical protein K6E21_00915 [Bacilli bacterium]|nr:hypothetical protein [Bacilli bacterium]